MAHTHHCHTCKIATAICDDSGCQHAEAELDDACTDAKCADPGHKHHYCSIHHHDPEHKVVPAPPTPKFAVTLLGHPDNEPKADPKP